MVSIGELFALAAALAVSGGVVTVCLYVLVWWFLPEWCVIFIMSALVAWFFMENRMLWEEVGKKAAVERNSSALDAYRVQALADMAMELHALRSGTQFDWLSSI